LKKYGKKHWRRYVADAVERLVAAMEPDDIVLGGGNARKIKELPAGCRLGDNANAFLGGFRLWEKTIGRENSDDARRRPRQNAKIRFGPGKKTKTS